MFRVPCLFLENQCGSCGLHRECAISQAERPHDKYKDGNYHTRSSRRLALSCFFLFSLKVGCWGVGSGVPITLDLNGT